MLSHFEAVFSCQNINSVSCISNSIYCNGKTTLPNCNTRKPIAVVESNPGFPLCFGMFRGECDQNLPVKVADLASGSFKEAANQYEDYLTTPREFLTETVRFIYSNLSNIPIDLDASLSFSIIYLTSHEIYLCAKGNCQALRLRGNELIYLNRRVQFQNHSKVRADGALLNISKGNIINGDDYLIYTPNYESNISNMQIYNTLKYRNSGVEAVKDFLEVNPDSTDNTGGILLLSI